MNTNLLDRFCRYVRIDTTADEKSGPTYSRFHQPEASLNWADGSVSELQGAVSAKRHCAQDEAASSRATVYLPPATKVRYDCPGSLTMDSTSPGTTGRNVKPFVHRHSFMTAATSSCPATAIQRRFCEPQDNLPELAALKGKTIITTGRHDASRR